MRGTYTLSVRLTDRPHQTCRCPKRLHSTVVLLYILRSYLLAIDAFISSSRQRRRYEAQCESHALASVRRRYTTSVVPNTARRVLALSGFTICANNTRLTNHATTLKTFSMSNNRDHIVKQRRNDHLLKNLPTEVLLKARSTLVSLSGALKPKQDQQPRPKLSKQESKENKSHEQLKTSRSEPEFREMRKNKSRSRIDSAPREFVRPRPLSVGATKRFDKEMDDIHLGNFAKEPSIHQKEGGSSEDVCVQSRLVIPVSERLSNQDVQVQEVSERPRKKLSFRDPEIVGSGCATLGRSHKLMGINSLNRRPNRLSLRSDTHYSSLDGLDCDLEVGKLLSSQSVYSKLVKLIISQ